MIDLVGALSRPLPCICECHERLTVLQRVQGVRALFRFDDTMRGWGYDPIYAPRADELYREAQKKNDTTYRKIAVRDEPCVYQRLVGFVIHELLHALQGDVTQANYGLPFGLPYGVPADLPPSEEAAWLAPFNLGEARAWVGIAPLAKALYGIEWPLRTARNVGTYGFVGGNAIVEVPRGFRPVTHVDRQHSPDRYYAYARRLEAEAAEWFTDARVAELAARVVEAEALGRARRKKPWPDPEPLARLSPRVPGGGDPCVCGSGKKWKRCCADYPGFA